MIKGLKLEIEKVLGAENYYNKAKRFTGENGLTVTVYIKEMENVVFNHIILEKEGKMLTKRNKEYKQIFGELEQMHKTVNHYTLKKVKGIEVVEYK